MPVADTFWGDRYGSVEDPWGHFWSVAAPIDEARKKVAIDAWNKMISGGAAQSGGTNEKADNKVFILNCVCGFSFFFFFLS